MSSGARLKRPWLAGLLSAILPGLGSIYAGYVARGIALFAAWWLLFAVARGPAPGFLIEFTAVLGVVAAWVYGIVDAARRAREVNARGYLVLPDEARSVTIGPVDDEQVRVLGIGLVVVGVLLFAQQVGGFLLDLLRFALPVGLIGLGAWIMHRARLKSQREDFESAGESGAGT